MTTNPNTTIPLKGPITAAHVAEPQAASSFAQAKALFDAAHENASHTDCIVPVRGKAHPPVSIRNSKAGPNEEYYKWQFINALVQSGLYPKDYIGVEVHFPKGNKSAAALKLDAAIFDDPAWVDHYNGCWTTKKSADLEWLNEHLIAIAEFKKGDKEIEKVFTGQVKGRPAERGAVSCQIGFLEPSGRHAGAGRLHGHEALRRRPLGPVSRQSSAVPCRRCTCRACR